MSTVQNTDTRLPGTVAEIRGAAAAALDAWAVRSPEEAADLLGWWRRRAEMTDADVAAVLDAVFPASGPAGSVERTDVADRSDDFRDGYVEGFLDAIAVMAKMRAETLDAAAPDRDGGLAERFLARQRQERLVAVWTCAECGIPLDADPFVTPCPRCALAVQAGR